MPSVIGPDNADMCAGWKPRVNSNSMGCIHRIENESISGHAGFVLSILTTAIRFERWANQILSMRYV